MGNNKFKLYLHISPSWKYYVGITSLKTVEERWGSEGHGYNSQYFKRAIDKYGWNNFIHIIICKNLSKEDACELEKLFIEQLKSNIPQHGYNVSNGGECTMLGKHHSKEAKQKISDRFSEAVDQYSKNGSFIKSWKSMIDAEIGLNIDRSAIAKCCKGIYKTSKGFVWRYKGESFNKYNLNKKSQRINVIKVKQFSVDGKLIKVWDSISQVAQYLHVSTSSISRCCKGYKGRKTVGGFVWRYIEDPFDKYSIENEKYSPVCQFDLDGKYISSFKTIISASKGTGISSNDISMCCSNKIKTSGGYIWRYKDKMENKHEQI